MLEPMHACTSTQILGVQLASADGFCSWNGKSSACICRYFLAGDDARCQAADDEVLAQARAREEQVLAEVEALKQVGSRCWGLLVELMHAIDPSSAIVMAGCLWLISHARCHCCTMLHVVCR